MPGACGTQTRCSCSHLNLFFKCSFLTDKVRDANQYYLLVLGGSHFACIVAGTFFIVKIYMSVRSHGNELQVLQLQQASPNAQTVNVKRLMKFAIIAVHVCFVLMICYLPNICFFFVIVFPVVGHVKLYTLTLAFLNSSLNPLISCWKMRHVQHTLIDLLRNAFSKRN